MLIGFYMCIILVPCFAVLALVFAGEIGKTDQRV